MKCLTMGIANMASTSIYDDSNITMCAGYRPPNDEHLMHAFKHAEKSTMAMAMHLVLGYGHDKPNKVEDSLMADMALLTLVLGFCSENGEKDIQRIIDMPVAYYARWTKSLKDAEEQGIIPKTEDAPSASELDDMFEM
tara:strand:+ start:41 stop:454 length:414 start_codon:yes stop_codon:yes gene_type:complete